MTINEYINATVGSPWVNRAEGPDAFDCWGLVIDSFRRIDGVEIPQIDGYTDGSCNIGDEAAKQIAGGSWSKATPCDGAVMIIYEHSRIAHVGRCLGGGVLHAFGKNGEGAVKWDTYKALNRRNKNIEYFKYAAN